MADLVVELYGTCTRVLRGTWRTFDFVPDAAAVVEFDVDRVELRDFGFDERVAGDRFDFVDHLRADSPMR